MASSSRSTEREEERRHNIRTLAIASVASATAAGVTSQLWIAGTWIAAATTPVLVALISELLNRPTEKIARAWTYERPAVLEPPPLPEAGGAAPPPPSRPRSSPPAPETPRPAQPGSAPVRVYRQPAGRPSRRKIALGAVFVTGGLAFVIAVVTITAGELIAGDSIGKGSGRTTFVGGSRGGNDQDNNTSTNERDQTSTEERTTTERQQDTTQERQPTQTETTQTQPTQTEQTQTQTSPSRQSAPTPTTPAETAPAP